MHFVCIVFQIFSKFEFLASQRSAATYLRCVTKYYTNCRVKFVRFSTVKELGELVKF